MIEKIDKHKLRGSVKLIVFDENSTSSENSNIIDPEGAPDIISCVKELSFNQDGLLTEKRDFYGLTIYLYDSLLRKHEAKTFSEINNNGNPKKRVEYKYNEKGLLSELVILNYEVWEHDLKSEYVELEPTIYKIMDLPLSTEIIVYFYDDNNKLIELRKYDDSKKLECNYIVYNQYDAQGNIISQTKKYPNGTEFGNDIKKFHYNAENLLVKKEWIESSSLRLIETSTNSNPYSEDKFGLYEKTNWVNRHSVHTSHSFEYNDFSDLIKIKIELRDILQESNPIIETSIRTYEYTYDSLGNLTQRQELINGIKFKTEIRTIEYFTEN